MAIFICSLVLWNHLQDRYVIPDLYYDNMRHILQNESKNNRKINVKKSILAVVVICLSLFLMTGCIPNGYTKKEKNVFLKEAKEIASEYLKSKYDGATIKNIDADTAVEDMEYVLTEFASGQFDWKGQTFDFTVDTRTGEVYTSVHLEKITAGLCETLLRELEIDSRDAAVVNCRIRYLRGDHPEDGRVNWGWADAVNVFPEGKTAEELLWEILTEESAYSFYMDIQYRGGEIPQEIMEAEFSVPTLTDIHIYHIADEHELYQGNRGRSFLPCLSEEILWRSYEDDTAGYIRNQVLERDGLRIIYNAYERTREQKKVTEKVIDEKDIDLTVRDDYIALRCTKEHFSMYLATTDRNIAQEYLYAFDYFISEKKPLKGGWYSYEDFYIYSESKSIEMPYVFNSLRKEKNVLFSKENYNIF